MAGSGKGAFRIAIEDFVETYISPAFSGWFSERTEAVEDHLIEAQQEAIDELLDADEIPDNWKQTLGRIFRGEQQGGIASIVGFGAQLGMNAASGLMAPLMRLLNYRIERKAHTARGDPPVAWAIAKRHPEHAVAALEGLKDLGWTEDWITAWEEVLKPTIPEGDLIAWLLRNPDAEELVRSELSSRGWVDDRIDKLFELREIIPGVQDLIQMAVREAFRDDIAERFQYDQDFPSDIVPWAEKIGLSQFWLEKYWRAHWDLPSISAGYEMLHRLRPGQADHPFTEDDLLTLLRTADIPAFFRERLIEISYRPYTRVDVRRMYGLGVLDEDGVYQAYLDIGFNEERARNMTDFTILFETDEQRQSTRSLIERGYKRKVLSRDEAYQALVNLNYRNEDAEYFLTLVDAELAEEDVNLEIERVEFLYKEGEISQPEVYGEIGHLNLPSDQINKLIVQWDIEKRKEKSLPTKSDLEQWYRQDIITLDEWQEGMSKRRYDEQAISRYGQQIDLELAQEAAKEAERAQKEQERIQEAVLATQYDRQQAELDKRIANIKVAIADIKVTLHEIEDTDLIAERKQQIDELKATIARLRERKAEISLEEIE